ncbi:unnamed protein product [Ostreobium quekettii]|uniref:Uncharacterized protein n=1 Tax=Ostreobium quekettii TaxID=121088 RepID=A0A8S1J183_9CHLO|nr:unnamed protein product [Ostreobium quekettii]|eukprot:evm.model.scf_891.7 EVM.evm.TU.scf_891.7   scf_891:56135-59552(-)
MASPWAKATPKVTDWSEQVEEEEAQNGGDLVPPEAVPLDEEAFPSLGDAAKVKTPKKKKGGQKMTLGEFVGKSGAPSRRRIGPMMSDQEIAMNLPTGPRERGPGEEDGGWGQGGRSGFGGGYRSGGFGDREDRGRDDMGPSRADEADNWGSQKQFVPSSGGYGSRPGGYGGGGFSSYDRPRSSAGSRYDDAPMARASDSDNWSRDNRFEPSRDSQRGRSGFGGGFYEPPPPRRGYGFRDRDDRGMRGGGFGDRDPMRTEGGSWTRARSYTPNSEGPGEDGGGERPRLNLAPRKKPLAGPGSDGGAEGGGRDASTPSKRSSIFGDARPREEVLKERGGSDISGSAPHVGRTTPTSEVSSRAGSRTGSRAGSRAGTPASPVVRSPREAPKQPFVRPHREDPFGGARPREDNLGQRMMEKDAEEELSKGIEAM